MAVKANGKGPQSKPAASTASKTTSAAPAKFYNGPTVQAVAKDVKGKAAAVSEAVSAKIDPQTKQAVTKAAKKTKAASSSFLSSWLVRAVTFGFLFSLFVCPPNYDPSTTSAICTPASRWHSLAQPHVQPYVDSIIATSKSAGGPYYNEHVAPHVASAKARVEPIAQSVVRVSSPVVRSARRGSARLYKLHAEPRIHYASARLGKAIRPYVTELELRWKILVVPRLQAAEKKIKEIYARVEAEPRLRLVRQKTAEWAGKTYAAAGPLSAKGFRLSKHHWTNTVVPLSQKGYTLGKHHGLQAGVLTSKHLNAAHSKIIRPYLDLIDSFAISHVYTPYLAKYLDPLAAKLAPTYRIIAKHISLLDAKVEAFVLSYFYKLVPSAIPPPPTFFEKVAAQAKTIVDAVPTVSIPPMVSAEPEMAKHVPTEEDEDLAFIAELEKAKNPSQVAVPEIKEPALPPLPDSKTSTAERKELERQKVAAVAKMRAEIEKKHDDYEAKLEEVGKYEEERLVQQVRD